MSYQTQNALITNDLFLQRVRQAIMTTALAVQSELPATLYHNQRGTWALWCLKNGSEAARVMAPAIVCDDLTTDSVTDAQLDSRVSAVWNAFAVVTV